MREWWIRTNVCTLPLIYDTQPILNSRTKGNVIHVIEKSAYDALAAENEKLKTCLFQMQNAAIDLNKQKAELIETIKDAIEVMDLNYPGRLGAGQFIADSFREALAKHGGENE